MPAAFPPEFRRRAVELFREHDEPVSQLAVELGISESCLRRWAAGDDVDAGRRDGVSGHERSELAHLPRDKHRLEVENDDPAPSSGRLRAWAWEVRDE